MKSLPRFSLFALLFFLGIASVYMALAKLLNLQVASILVIAICAVITLAMAIRVFFFDR